MGFITVKSRRKIMYCFWVLKQLPRLLMSKRLASSIPRFPKNRESSLDIISGRLPTLRLKSAKWAEISKIMMKRSTSKVNFYSLTSRDRLIYKDITSDKASSLRKPLWSSSKRSFFKPYHFFLNLGHFPGFRFRYYINEEARVHKIISLEL